jgi:hypothetical protein
VEIIPYVPIATTLRTGVSIFTYSGQVTFGITGDYATTPDLDVLADGIEDGIADLLRVVPPRRAKRPARHDKSARAAKSAARGPAAAKGKGAKGKPAAAKGKGAKGKPTAAKRKGAKGKPTAAKERSSKRHAAKR